MVWSLLLQDDSEGPTLIDYTVTQNKSSVADSFCSWRTQNVNLAPNWNRRGELEVCVIWPKPSAAVHPVSALGTFGDENCGLLATL